MASIASRMARRLSTSSQGKGAYSGREVPHPMLYLLDIKMPRVDGVEVLRQLKADPQTALVPVIMLTTTDDPREVQRCYELGCSVYITKPVDYQAFVEAHKPARLVLAGCAHSRQKLRQSVEATMESRSRAKILLVEDDPGVARLEQLQLERAGFAVVIAMTADEGLEELAKGEIELIVLDQRLSSGTSGLEFFRQVKDAGYNVPAILVTGLNDENTLLEALRAGVRDFVPKTPNFLNHLEPIVTRVLDQVRTERELAESRVMAREHEARRRELEHEIAQRKRVERALREAEEYLRLMVESVKDFAIFTVDPQGRIVSWNPGAERLFGFAEPEILGQHLNILFTPEDRAAAVPEREIANAAATGRAPTNAGISAKTAVGFSPAASSHRSSTKTTSCRGFTKICATSPSANKPKKPSARRPFA